MTKGHNSVDAGQLHSLIQRIEKLEVEKANIASDIGEVYLEAKSAGYDVPVLKALIRERKQDAEKLAEKNAMLGVYRDAISA